MPGEHSKEQVEIEVELINRVKNFWLLYKATSSINAFFPPKLPFVLFFLSVLLSVY